eukprot:CAMPEP_0172005702 /NCGR_PEP_ID=MMETSP1041-20130122/5180_1 /TAXON_ID=464988 /ORGANISM="Hemiselmis andersenii, Strain CCMP439" /LENGTH=133 /DNA_ID=CAMNT_0012659699 /DNA_START=274 /DNA_END=675 /DNA_ORIENTATION=+
MVPALSHDSIDPVGAPAGLTQPQPLLEDALPQHRVVGDLAIGDLGVGEDLPHRHAKRPHVALFPPPSLGINLRRHPLPFEPILSSCLSHPPLAYPRAAKVCHLDPHVGCVFGVQRVHQDVSAGNVPVHDPKGV